MLQAAEKDHEIQDLVEARSALEAEAKLRAEQLEESRKLREQQEKELSDMAELRAQVEAAATEQAQELENARRLAEDKAHALAGMRCMQNAQWMQIVLDENLKPIRMIHYAESLMHSYTL